MRIALITNLASPGLALDARLVREFLETRGHECEYVQFNDLAAPRGRYDLAVSMEVAVPEFLEIAPRHWLFANPEWTKPEYHRTIQRSFDRVFAKTRDAERVLRERFTNVYYTGFLTQDRRDTSIERLPRCLHIGGKSGFKNTNAVVAAWREYRYWDGSQLPELTVVSSSNMVEETETPGVRFVRKATDTEIAEMMNSHLFHLCPSAYEGWGHAVHEARGVGAVILSTDAPPMQEFGSPFHVPSVRQRKNNLGMLQEVSPAAIREVVPRMLAQPNHVVARMQAEARARFVRGNEEFDRLFEPHVEGVARASGGRQTGSEGTDDPQTTLAILGNFGPSHSTENELLWTLRDMGYRVIPFQENEARTEEILRECIVEKVSLLLYIHTHGWETLGKISVLSLIESLRANGVKTASFHLDRYWGLNQLDHREDRVGEHPFWHTDAVFTADGGNETRFKERGVNHYWLPPGVVKRDCYLGEVRDEYRTDVGFVGAEGYHPEYSFRGELLQFLRSIYGSRFRVFQGIRGKTLNDLYASIKVVVGDSCFGGSDYYWSDRVTETLGRGGFLVHPECRGLRIPGLVTFAPGDLGELQDRIDYYLVHDEEREFLRRAAHAWVRENETYHNRMDRLLRTMGVR